MIKSVYQPIVSLWDGQVLGYEALSRITLEQVDFNIEQLFQIGGELNQLWELEELCRKKSLKHGGKRNCSEKLFLNVDPGVIHDPKFKAGVTCKYLQKYGLSPENIVFEITERSAIDDNESFVKTISHYRDQLYEIAIDDFGAGYAGLNRVCALAPNYIKIDMALVRGINKDAIKKSLVESFTVFCKNAGIKLIAEGIETKEELEELIRMGVDYGQGYYLKKPSENIEGIEEKIVDKISYMNLKFRP